MAHVGGSSKKLLTRVRRIRGQVDALETALAGDPECMAVLTQIAAVRGAVNGLMMEVLDGHLREHLARERSAGKREAEINEVTAILRSYFK
ncbi:metal/formaldehyde-sensitive transcriptional repressor [Noviluteimonas gilva]|uniref:Metal-sensing transcriptional repressor n=1 Tax=Noviluteimonas gilva TaxID=2682097 RepID=A0A7C9HNB2_9GAMM|nr:metal/formaldehyde-sensitive transcriptional repressor [Lysobacter gilvus]MUV15155.1 metal-sensing transcriptional repressor [Lysobacter gilvus]